MANDFSGDSNCIAVFNLESGALTTDSKGTNTLTDNNTVTEDTSNYKQGSCSAFFNDTNAETLTCADSALDTGFPLKSGESNLNWSFAFWIKPPASAINSYVFAKYASGNGLNVKLDYSENLIFTFYDAYSSDNATYPTALSGGTWYHVGVTLNGSTNDIVIRVWDDNAGAFLDSDHEETLTVHPDVNAGTFILGGYTSNPELNGNLDEFVVFNDILTTTEIDQIRSGTFGGGGSTAINIFDGKIIIKNAATNLLDGKTVLKSAATGLLDGEVAVKDMATNLLDGKAVIKTDAVNLLDGKVIVKDIATALLDGRLSIQDVATGLLDGKIKIGNLATGLLDGKIIIKDIATDLLDGLLVIGDKATDLLDGSLIVSKQATALLDGKVTVKDVATGLLDGSLTVKTDAVQLLDGKVAIQNVAVNMLDGSLTVVDAATCLLDGKLVVSSESAVNLLDGKIILQASVGMMEITVSADGPVITLTTSGPEMTVSASGPEITFEPTE